MTLGLLESAAMVFDDEYHQFSIFPNTLGIHLIQ